MHCFLTHGFLTHGFLTCVQASAHSPEQEDDPELRAAIAASLADQGSGGSVVAPAHGPSAPYYVYPPPPPGGEP